MPDLRCLSQYMRPSCSTHANPNLDFAGSHAWYVVEELDFGNPNGSKPGRLSTPVTLPFSSRGFGESEAPAEMSAYTVSNGISDITALLDELGVNK